MESSTIQALPTIWPGRNSSEPNASQRKMIEFDHKTGRARSEHREDEPAPRKRRVDPEIGHLGQEERGRRGEDEQGRGQQRRYQRACKNRGRRSVDAQPALHQVAQDECKPDHGDARWGHEPRRDRHETRSIRNTVRAGMTNEPVCSRYGQREQEEKHYALPQALCLPFAADCRAAFHLANPSERNLHAGHSPQP